ncbi:hypothetical protein PR202_gb16500 [Eleusine coracana subsp. coracana]|uniref:Uncharacterized protein n=1 Tax=Eleusine coracana subsp. coracana TaxID=191504 RepID=A0AAV5F155_ELECO|nr:hypothetical protein PR202_gb16500 [Eleusine coracana subsp. coracana]
MGGDDSPAPPVSAPAAKVYYDGCPGCDMERKKESNKGVPYKELLFVGVITLAAGASYLLGRGFASIFWGMVADRIGRKQVIAFSIFSVIIFNTLFGLSVKYWMAITTRFLLGALNGFLGPIKETLHNHKGLEGVLETAEGATTQESPEVPKESLFKNWPLMSSILTYCVFSLHDTAYTEIFSLWTVSDRKYGGLSFSSKDVGQVLTVAGLKLGLALYSAAMIKSVLAITILTGTSLLQNNAVPQEQRGAANGIATTAMSLFKAAAPAAGGVIFSWAQKRQHAAFFPGDQMVFLLLNLTEVIGLMLTFKPFLAVPKQFYK